MFGDEYMMALCAWRENRHGLQPGMQSVMNCICNSAKIKKRSIYEEVMHKWRYSSMTDPNDGQLSLWPEIGDVNWLLAQQLSGQAIAGTLPDITNGADLYYALTIKKVPFWEPYAKETAIVAGQRFMLGAI